MNITSRFRSLLYERDDVAAVTGRVVLVAGCMVGVLALLGRRWWCACGQPFLWASDAWGEHNSQHIADAYVFSHILHGVIFYWAFRYGFFKRRWRWALVLAVVVEAAWEILENTPMVIERYRAATASLGYTGDTIANSTADLLAAIVGFFIARRIGFWGSLALFVVLEVGCLLWIRDNLTLNVVMLIYPIPAIRNWQAG